MNIGLILFVSSLLLGNTGDKSTNTANENQPHEAIASKSTKSNNSSFDDQLSDDSVQIPADFTATEALSNFSLSINGNAETKIKQNEYYAFTPYVEDLNNNIEDKTIFKLGCNVILDYMRETETMTDYKYDNRNVNNQYFYYDSMFNFEQLQMISCNVKVTDSEVQTNDSQYTFFSSAEFLSIHSNEHCFDFASNYTNVNYSEISFFHQMQHFPASVEGYYFLFAKGRSFSGMVNGKDSVIFKNGRDPAITIAAEMKMETLSGLEGEGTQESPKIYKSNEKRFSGCEYDGCYFDGIFKNIRFRNTENKEMVVYIEFEGEELRHKNIHFPADPNQTSSVLR